jgi:hypothetical protein
MKNTSKTFTEEYRSESRAELSELSLSTENKVFGGALNLLNNPQPSKCKAKDSNKEAHSRKTDTLDEQSFSGSPKKFFFDERKININEVIDNSNALEPLSFRPSNRNLVDGYDKNILENSHQEDSTNYTMHNTLTSSKHSANKFEYSKFPENNINNNIKYTNESSNENVIPKTVENVKDNNFINEAETEIYADIEEKELANFEGDDEEDLNKNVFWNLPKNINNNDPNVKKMKSEMKEHQTCSAKPQPRSFNSTQINCVFSKIEKGNAIFVSSDDIIFSLPLSFLPRNAVPGNTYKISVEETEKIHKKITYLQNMQKRFLLSNFDANHK